MLSLSTLVSTRASSSSSLIISDFTVRNITSQNSHVFLDTKIKEPPSLLKRPRNAKRATVLGENVALNFKPVLGKKKKKNSQDAIEPTQIAGMGTCSTGRIAQSENNPMTYSYFTTNCNIQFTMPYLLP